jgi:endonuclease/exonuclease/phosphatase family metal-dependent hydrolase
MIFAPRRAARRRGPAAFLRIEQLEARALPATVSLRIADYNIASSTVAPRNGLDTILQAIGDEATYAPARPIDVLALQEVGSQSSTTQAVVNLLNAIYGANTYARGTLNGSTAGSGTQGLVYRTSTVQLVSEFLVPIPAVNIGSADYTPLRQPIRYELRPVGAAASETFYLYNSHYKADMGTSEQNLRQAEAIDIRADADALGQGKNILYVGDFNGYTSAEAFYSTTLLGSGNGQAFDPIDRPGAWHSSPGAFVDILTQAPSNSPPAGFTGGGLDDRFDFQLVSGELLDGTGFEYVAGTYHVFGNNGSVPANGDINSPGSTALAGLPNRTMLLDLLTTVSDHLPVIADYSFPVAAGTPAIGSFAVNPSSVAPGGAFTLTASNVMETGGTIAAVNFYRETNANAGLQIGGDALVGPGSQSGTTWTLATNSAGLALGNHTYYAVATDAVNVNSAASTAILTVANPVASGPLLGWNMTGQSMFGTQGLPAGLVAIGLANSLGLTRGSGVATASTAANNAWGGNGWAATSAAGIAASAFASFGFTVANGYAASLSSIDMNYRRSMTAPPHGFWQFQINGGAWNDIGDFTNQFSSTSSSGAEITALNLANTGALQHLSAGTSVSFRVVPYGGTGAGGNWYVFDLTGNDLVVSGTIETATATTLVATPLATTGGSSVMFTATVAPSPGALGTVTFLDNGVPIPGGANVALSNGTAVFSTTTLALGSHPITASFSGAIGLSPSVSGVQTVVIGAQPKVNSVAINGNIASLAGPQRSRVASLVVAFDQAVQLDAGAMSLALHTGVTFDGAAHPAGYGTLPASLNLATSDNITWTITFTGNTEGGADGFHSLKDGVYDLKIDAAKVHPFGAPGANMAADSITTFNRLFGDDDAPTTPDGGTPGADFRAIVDTGDNLSFRGAFNNPGNYKSAFDFTGDGLINTGDNLAFRGRFNKALSWSA